MDIKTEKVNLEDNFHHSATDRIFCDFEKMKTLCGFMNIDRFEDYFSLKNICSAFKTHEFSSNSFFECVKKATNVHKIVHLEKLWDSSDRNFYKTIKTIAFYARKDNPKKYNDWIKSHYLGLLTGKYVNENIEARFIHAHLEIDYIYDFESKCLFEFKNHIWLAVGIEKIFQFITNDIKKILKDIVKDLSDHLSESKCAIFEENTLFGIKQTQKLLFLIESRKFLHEMKTNILYLLSKAHKLDLNANLTGVKNGILEANKSDGKIYFREGIPEDYISRSVSWDFDESLTWESENVVELKNWFEKCSSKKTLSNAS